jgi:pyruvate formate lyase activating enzyme
VCAGSLYPVLDTLDYVANQTDVWLEITTLLIPGLNDSDNEIAAMARWVVDNLGRDVPHHFTAFHPDYKMRDRPHTPPNTLTRAREIARGAGERHVYTGNVHDAPGQTTYCHACGEKLIERDWYRLGRWRLDDKGNCGSCGVACAGVFEAAPGDWGPNRRPVRLSGWKV